MTTALEVLIVLGILGALDTLYYHEWKLRLPETPTARRELRLHASRDFAYAIVFGSLAWTTWNGALLVPLVLILAFEIWVTLTDFLEEDRTRRLPAGERVMHAVMGIVYGVFLALLYPYAAAWAHLDSGFSCCKLRSNLVDSLRLCVRSIVLRHSRSHCQQKADDLVIEFHSPSSISGFSTCLGRPVARNLPRLKSRSRACMTSEMRSATKPAS